MSKEFNNLEDLLVLKLQALYDIETELIKALPKMAKNATNPDLKAAFTAHLEETDNHRLRLEDAFRSLDMKPKKETSAAIRGLIEDSSWIFKQEMTPEAKDALLSASAQYVEHFEMAGYTAASSWAETLGKDDIASLLRETLAEEEAAAEKLNGLSRDTLDEEAANAGSSDRDDEDDND